MSILNTNRSGNTDNNVLVHSNKLSLPLAICNTGIAPQRRHVSTSTPIKRSAAQASLRPAPASTPQPSRPPSFPSTHNPEGKSRGAGRGASHPQRTPPSQPPSTTPFALSLSKGPHPPASPSTTPSPSFLRRQESRGARRRPPHPHPRHPSPSQPTPPRSP